MMNFLDILQTTSATVTLLLIVVGCLQLKSQLKQMCLKKT